MKLFALAAFSLVAPACAVAPEGATATMRRVVAPDGSVIKEKADSEDTDTGEDIGSGGLLQRDRAYLIKTLTEQRDKEEMEKIAATSAVQGQARGKDGKAEVLVPTGCGGWC